MRKFYSAVLQNEGVLAVVFLIVYLTYSIL